jgi:hypothetical protein
MTPSGIEPTTFRFVAQYLNHCATISGPLISEYPPLLFTAMQNSNITVILELSIFLLNRKVNLL